MGSYVQIGVDVTAVFDAAAAAAGTGPKFPPYALGDRHVADDGTVYIYTKAHATIANGTRHNVLDTKVTSANASGAWVNNTGVSLAVNDRFWAHQYIASNVIPA